MRPITESLGSLDILSGKSEDYNKLIKAIGSDITTVFNMSNSNDNLTEQNMNTVVQENLFLQKKVKELEEQLAAIEKILATRSNDEDYCYLYKTFNTTDDIEYAEGTISQDTSYGVITLPCVNTQKIPFLKYSKEFLRKNLDIKATIGNVTIDLANDSNLLNIIDGDDSTFWSTEVNTGETKWGLTSESTYVDFSVTINMPTKLLPSLTLNAIGIKPHPTYSTTIKDIKYISTTSGTENRISTFPLSSEQPVPIEGIDAERFMFPTISTKSITFYLRQPYYKQNNGSRTFVIGIRSIDLESVNYASEEASFMTEFKIPGDNRYFLRILEPTVETLGDADFGDAVSYELYYDKVGTEPYQFGADIIADLDTIYIKTILTRIGDSVPAIKGIRLQYLPK
jgi:hypothetical protein